MPPCSTRMDAEVAVVGGGTAGAVVAARLAAAGRDVLVIEAGPDYGPAGAGGWPADLLDATALPTSHDWGYRATGAGGAALALDRARVLGGCSAHNGCTQNWGWRGDYDAWGRHSPGWSAADLAPAFARARGAMRLRHYAADEIQPFQAAFLDACAAAGHRLADDLDDLDGGAGAGCAPVNIVDGVRWNTAFAYLDPVRERPGCGSSTGPRWSASCRDAGGSTRIHARSPAGPVEIDAAETVLCGGAYGTPELLLRSGIGDRRALEPAGIAVRHDLPGVGRGLQEHRRRAARVRRRRRARRAARRLRPAPVAARGAGDPQARVTRVRRPVRPPRLPLDRAGRRRAPRVEMRLPRRAPHAPVARRRRAAAAPAAGRGSRTAISSDPSDVAALAHGIARGARAPRASAARRTARRAAGRSAGARPGRARGRTSASTTRTTGTRARAVRWARTRAQGAVVDEQARLHGMPAIRLADASIFPSIPRGTTAMPTTVVGERVAELMT